MGTTENKLEGVESGADAYVTKPFSLKLLLARMVQLIDQREKLREKYVNDPSIERKLFILLIKINSSLINCRLL